MSDRKDKKSVHALILSSDVCRLAGGARCTCCKSGKDRTSMSVTLEHARLLAGATEGCDVACGPESGALRLGVCVDGRVKRLKELCAVLRGDGVRRDNVLMNTGSTKFAFNPFQHSLLPQCYQPPPAACSNSVAS
jgi:hypothetical protein